MIEVRIHGYGGQGAVTLATLLMQAATNNGKYSQSLPFFGMERRGAPVRAVVRISDDEIRVHSQHCTADLVVLMSDKLYDIAVSDSIRYGAKFIVSSKDEKYECKYPGVTFDAGKIAQEHGLGTHAAAINVPLYAACCAMLDIPCKIMKATVLEKWGGEVGKRNASAAEASYRLVTRRMKNEQENG